MRRDPAAPWWCALSCSHSRHSWVKITQRVTVEIAPVFNAVASFAGNKQVLQDVLFRGPGKVSQAALGWGDLNFENPNDFLAMGMLHPIVLTLCVVLEQWVARRVRWQANSTAARWNCSCRCAFRCRAIGSSWRTLIVDLIVLPIICLAFFAGTQLGLAAVGPFIPEYEAIRQLPVRIPHSRTPPSHWM